MKSKYRQREVKAKPCDFFTGHIKRPESRTFDRSINRENIRAKNKKKIQNIRMTLLYDVDRKTK